MWWGLLFGLLEEKQMMADYSKGERGREEGAD